MCRLPWSRKRSTRTRSKEAKLAVTAFSNLHIQSRGLLGLWFLCLCWLSWRAQRHKAIVNVLYFVVGAVGRTMRRKCEYPWVVGGVRPEFAATL